MLKPSSAASVYSVNGIDERLEEGENSIRAEHTHFNIRALRVRRMDSENIFPLLGLHASVSPPFSQLRSVRLNFAFRRSLLPSWWILVLNGFVGQRRAGSSRDSLQAAPRKRLRRLVEHVKLRESPPYWDFGNFLRKTKQLRGTAAQKEIILRCSTPQ